MRDYFPAASHQVILLSTDTEVDAALLGGLAGAVSHAYRLDYDPVERRTRVEEGYFGDGRDRPAAFGREAEGGGLALQQA